MSEKIEKLKEINKTLTTVLAELETYVFVESSGNGKIKEKNRQIKSNTSGVVVIK